MQQYNREQIFDLVKATILDSYTEDDILPPNTITEASLLEAELGLDSLDQIELLLTLEEYFDVSISGERAKECINVKNIVDLVIESIA